MLKFNPTTPVTFWKKTSSYTAGQGQSTTWTQILTSPLFGEWRGGFGDRAIAAQAVGVSDMATCRTFYHPTLYAAMNQSQIIVVKNADSAAFTAGVPDRNNPNVYELWGGVDNVEQANQCLEFRVRRYEGK